LPATPRVARSLYRRAGGRSRSAGRVAVLGRRSDRRQGPLTTLGKIGSKGRALYVTDSPIAARLA